MGHHWSDTLEEVIRCNNCDNFFCGHICPFCGWDIDGGEPGY